jgi:para-nitrobenzyl esterase
MNTAKLLLRFAEGARSASNDIEVHLQELDWRPKGSKFGACHCLELALLFGSWERVGMLGNIDYTEWKRRCQLLRKQWLAFIK